MKMSYSVSPLLNIYSESRVVILSSDCDGDLDTALFRYILFSYIHSFLHGLWFCTKPHALYFLLLTLVTCTHHAHAHAVTRTCTHPSSHACTCVVSKRKSPAWLPCVLVVVQVTFVSLQGSATPSNSFSTSSFSSYFLFLVSFFFSYNFLFFSFVITLFLSITSVLLYHLYFVPISSSSITFPTFYFLYLPSMFPHSLSPSLSSLHIVSHQPTRLRRQCRISNIII